MPNFVVSLHAWPGSEVALFKMGQATGFKISQAAGLKWASLF